MSPIAAVIFDLGNVLLEVDETQALQRVCARTGRTPGEVEHYFASTPFAMQLSLGQLSRQEFFEIVARDLSFDGGYDEFALLWSEIFTPIESMVALADGLRERMPRFILSNTNAIHMDYIFANYPFMHRFNGHVLSYEVGFLKPDVRIYELALKKFGLAAEQTAFVDDILANVVAARAAGLRGIHYQNPDQVREELTKLGLTPI